MNGNPIKYFDFNGLSKRSCPGRVFLVLRGAVLATCKALQNACQPMGVILFV